MSLPIAVRAATFLLIAEGAAPLKEALVAKAPGSKTGYFMILDWKLEPAM